MATATKNPLWGGDIKAIDKNPRLHELDGISARTIDEHWKLYEGYVGKWKELTEKLASVDLSKANQIYSDVRAWKVDLTFAIGGVKNHQVYFETLGGDGSAPTGWLADAIERTWGSYDGWKADMKATGLSGRGWAYLAYDWDTGQLFNYIGDAQNTFPVWNATLLLALDVYEHAYFIDHGTNRAAYLDAWFANLDWAPVEEKVQTDGIDKLAASE
jgi:Fe-Mn family superoxide dismutase